MADISKITLPNNEEYNLKDKEARNQLNKISNKNLLDNWYFVGGGSQLGYGVFPINQRGQTNYTGTGYVIDRWKITGNSPFSAVTEISNDGIEIDNSSGTKLCWLFQVLDIPNVAGKYTFSALAGSVTGTVRICFLTSVNGIVGETVEFGENGFASYTYNFTTGKPAKVGILVSAGSSAVIKAAKLEYGDTQTLTHQDNGLRVLNEVPNFGEEMYRCQKYFYRIYGPETYGYMHAIGFGFANTSNVVRITIPLPAPMAATPTFTTESVLRFFHGNSTIEISNQTFTVYVARNNMPQIILNITDSDSGSLFTQYEPVILGLYAAESGKNFADISCEP